MAKIRISKPKKAISKPKQQVKPTVSKSKETRREDYNPIIKHGWFDLRYYYTKLRNKVGNSKKMLINMELLNGMFDTFYVYPKEESFKYKEGQYIIDDESKYYSVNAKCWCLDYHQEFNLPFKRKFPLNETREVMRSIDVNEVEMAINPSSLFQFINKKVIEGLMKGQQLQEDMRQLKLIAGIGAAAAVIHLLIFVFKSGMLNSVKLPF